MEGSSEYLIRAEIRNYRWKRGRLRVKSHLPNQMGAEESLAVLKMCDFRISELKAMHYNTV